MTNNEYDLKKLNESLDNLVPESATGVIKTLFPKIKEKRDQGVRLIDIYNALSGAGLRMKQSTFQNLVAKLLREDAEKESKTTKPGLPCDPVEKEAQEASSVEAQEDDDDRPISPGEAIVSIHDQDSASLDQYRKQRIRRTP